MCRWRPQPIQMFAVFFLRTTYSWWFLTISFYSNLTCVCYFAYTLMSIPLLQKRHSKVVSREKNITTWLIKLNSVISNTNEIFRFHLNAFYPLTHSIFRFDVVHQVVGIYNWFCACDIFDAAYYYYLLCLQIKKYINARLARGHNATN